MAKTLAEYLDWLDEREGLTWPKPPPPKPIKATPFLEPLTGIRAVTWSLYGTLLRIDTGRLHLIHPQPLRMQIALEKTIEEFHIWQSMSRKPGPPWEYMLQQYTKIVEDQQLTGTRRKGDVPEVDSTQVWGKLLERLERNEYQYDRGLYGEREDLALKVAYFFHASLQGVSAAEDAAATLQRLMSAGVRQGLLADAQPFSLAQTLRAFRQQRTLAGIGDLLSSDCLFLSCQKHVRKPSPTLYREAVQQFARLGIEASEVLHVSHRLRDDLAVAKEAGFRTALVVADAGCTQVAKEDVRDPRIRPDRLVTSLSQVIDILGV